MGRSFEMPTGDTSTQSEWAGREREYENRTVLVTDEDREVYVVDYLQEKGLYVVGDVGGQGPFYRLSPDKLSMKTAIISEAGPEEESSGVA